MQPHQQRVVDEKAELDAKLAKLLTFIMNNPTYKTLPAAEQHRLSQQSGFMQGYSNVLAERIAAF